MLPFWPIWKTSGKAENSIEQFAYTGAPYNDPMNVLERKLGQQHAIFVAHLDKLNKYAQLKMDNCDINIAYASLISSLVGVFPSLPTKTTLKNCLQILKKLAAYTLRRTKGTIKNFWSSIIGCRQNLTIMTARKKPILIRNSESHQKQKLHQSFLHQVQK